MFLCVIGAQAHAKEFQFQKEIDQLYITREGSPLWISDNRLNEKGVLLYETLKLAWHHGLNPEQYNTNLEGLEALQKELLLTQGLIKYAQDLSGMRIDPKKINLDPNFWKQKQSAKEIIGSLTVNKKPFKEYLVDLSPKTQTYQKLKSEMMIRPSVQLALNMERLRWLPNENPEKFIIVNIPSARLWAIEKSKAVIEMPVIVGRKDRPTPSFISNATGVRFNPTWTVPPTIKEKDIWPKLKENPYYLRDKQIEVFENGHTIDPTILSWNKLSKRDLHTLRMVQLPGNTNPLGRVRVLMPNKHSIFLHDTSEHAFSDLERTYSSGCVRLENPKKIAAFILQKDVKKYLSDQITRDVIATNQVQVRILYHTVWIGKNQKVIYGKDIYGYDRKLEEVLRVKNALYP